MGEDSHVFVIPMSTNYAPFLINFCLYLYEEKFFHNLLKNKKKKHLGILNFKYYSQIYWWCPTTEYPVFHSVLAFHISNWTLGYYWYNMDWFIPQSFRQHWNRLTTSHYYKWQTTQLSIFQQKHTLCPVVCYLHFSINTLCPACSH